MFIVTYTAEHNHRAPTHKNALAGTTSDLNTLSITSKRRRSPTNSTSIMSPCCSLDDDVMKCMDDDDDDVMKFYDMDDDVSCRTMDCFFEDGFLQSFY